VSLDAINGMDQTGKRYWITIEDIFLKLLPPVENPVDRTYRSLQGRWDVIKSLLVAVGVEHWSKSELYLFQVVEP
jgi:hypothetical protein